MAKTNDAAENRYYIEPGEPLPSTPEPEDDLRPWPGTTKVVGTSPARIDAYERVSGTALYTQDVLFPDMLHAALLRCPHPHARVTRIDTGAAERMPGVSAVLTHRSPGADIPWYRRTGQPQSRLFDPHCRYEGEEVAAVAAETEEQARDALRAIDVEYELLPFVVDPEEALGSAAPPVHGETNLEGGAIALGRGDVEQGFAEAAAVAEETFTVGTHVHTPMESFGSVARWEGKDLYLWDSTQGVYSVMSNVAGALGLSLNNVHVKCPYVGGGFGAKLRTGKYSVIAALMARMTARPVKLFLSREEALKCAGNRPSAKMTVKAGARMDGTLTALEFRSISTGGAYGGNRYVVFGQVMELYLCPNVKVEERWAYTHTGPARAMRAPGFPQCSFALEQVMDMLAEKLDLDPVELRLRNVPTHSQLDREGRPYTSTGLGECMTKGAEAFGWARSISPGSRPRSRSGERGHVMRGVGMAACTWWAGDGGPPSTAVVRMFVDGSVTIRTGASDLGTGTKTVAAMVVAEELALSLDRIRVVNADTATTPYHYVSGGSQTLPGAIPAVRQGAYEVKKQLLAYAAEDLQAPADRLELEGGVVRVRGETGKEREIGEILRSRDLRDIVGVGYRGKNPEDKIVRPFGAQFAEVEVNTRTGEVRVLRLLGAHDSGRVINRATFENQVCGGMVHGLGFGMTEHRVIDAATGKVVTANLHDYKIPTALDVPSEHEVVPIDPGDTECNNLGVKGLGEPPVIPTAAAIANAVYDATGVRVTDAPIGPPNVIQALAREGGGER
jgi:xanthine dehydrogenase YagR molybdenum-binding subunit